MSDSDDDFITEDQIQTLGYINLVKATQLYANDEKAMLEMFVGFADLAEHRILQQLQDAAASQNRACLLETADFLARVPKCLRCSFNIYLYWHLGSRIRCSPTYSSSCYGSHSMVHKRYTTSHIRVFLSSVAASNVDDFTTITPALDRLIQEIKNTIEYIKLYKADASRMVEEEAAASFIPTADSTSSSDKIQPI